MLLAIFIILVVLSLLGLSFHVGGGYIYLLLVAALTVRIVQLVTTR
jgi:hypothetical protein